MTPAVEVSGVSYAFGARVALDDVTLAVAPGESFGIMGPNGSGKSTLLGLLTTRLRPARGTVRILGTDAVGAAAAVRGLIGVVPQGPTLDRFLTLGENLEVWARLQGIRPDAIPAAVTDALLAADVAERRHERAGALSGGLARRAELARALLHRPAVLLLDEAGGALDPGARAEWRDRLAALRRDGGLTVVTVTHDMDEAGRCDRVAMLAGGRIAGMGTPADLCAAVGAPVETIETVGDAVALAVRLADALGVTPGRVDGTIRFTHPQAHALVQRIAEVGGRDIARVSVSPPSLEEAFVSLTGTRWERSR